MPLTSVAEVVGWQNVISSPIEVAQALAAMGLTEEILHDAIEAGEIDRDACTANNPPTDAGGRSHGTTVRALRESLIPSGWAACNVRNFSTVVAPDVAMEIAVASGDDATGRPDRTPRTKNKKGELMSIGIERNIHQLSLFELPPVARTNTRDARATLMLLRHRPAGSDVVRCELSVPMGMSDDDRVNEWGTRIILRDLVLDGRGGRLADYDASDDTIDVSVVRRSA